MVSDTVYHFITIIFILKQINPEQTKLIEIVASHNIENKSNPTNNEYNQTIPNDTRTNYQISNNNISNEHSKNFIKNPVFITCHIALSSYFFGFKTNRKFLGVFTCIYVSIMITIHLILSLTVGSCSSALYTNSHLVIPCDNDIICQQKEFVDSKQKSEIILPNTTYIETKYCDINTKTCMYKNSNSICSSTFDYLKYGGLNTATISIKWWTLFTYSLYHINFLHLITNILLFIPLSLSIESLYSPFFCALIIPIMAIASSLMILYIYKSTILVIGVSGVVYGFLGFIIIHRFFNPIYSIHIYISIALLCASIITFFVERYFILNISTEGHIGGFISGILLALLFFKRCEYKKINEEYATYPYFKIAESTRKLFKRFSWILNVLGIILMTIYFTVLVNGILKE